jgi:pyridoxal phosphate enzyme (YggS family)
MTEQASAAEEVAANLAAVRERIGQAVAESGRPAGAVTLVAVSKAQPIERIEAALLAGQRIFGENYVQESAGRWPELRQRYPDAVVHLVGPLQTNKVKDAVRLFDVIQSVDREKLARELAKELAKSDRRLQLMIEVNLGEEPQKAGIMPQDLDGFVALCRELALPVVGLMAIPPGDQDVGPYAALLAKLAARHGLAEVSVGMSGDFETAAQFGATLVRVGTAIFGTRMARKAA